MIDCEMRCVLLQMRFKLCNELLLLLDNDELWLLPPPRELDDELWPPPCEPPPRPCARAGLALSTAASAKTAINLLVFIIYPFFLVSFNSFFTMQKYLHICK